MTRRRLMDKALSSSEKKMIAPSGAKDRNTPFSPPNTGVFRNFTESLL
jgi:hypothetical protein